MRHRPCHAVSHGEPSGCERVTVTPAHPQPIFLFKTPPARLEDDLWSSGISWRSGALHAHHAGVLALQHAFTCDTLETSEVPETARSSCCPVAERAASGCCSMP